MEEKKNLSEVPGEEQDVSWAAQRLPAPRELNTDSFFVLSSIS